MSHYSRVPSIVHFVHRYMLNRYSSGTSTLDRDQRGELVQTIHNGYTSRTHIIDYPVKNFLSIPGD